jgi:Flp pilus assembly protein TadG
MNTESKQSVKQQSKTESERGAILVIVPLLMISLLGFIGLVLDIGYAYVQKNRLQSVTDAATLSCALANAQSPGQCLDGDTEISNPGVLAAVDPYGFGLTAKVPETCPHEYASNCVKVSGTITWNTFLLSLFNIPTLTAHTDAIAGNLGPSTPCLHGLGITGNNISFSNHQTSIFRCWIASNSSASNSISIEPQSAVSTTVGVVTAGLISGNIVSPVQLLQHTPIPDAYAGKTPPTIGTCLQTDYKYKLCETLPSGTYCGLIISPGSCLTTQLEGTYVIRQGTKPAYPGLSFEGGKKTTITGTDLTLYNYDGTIETDKQNGNLNLSAPITGDLKNILIWQRFDNMNPLVISGDKLKDGKTIQLNGVTYAPGATMTFIGGNEGTMTIKDIVANQISILSSVDVSPVNAEAASQFRPGPVLLD